MAPLLDEAMSGLRERDRQAVLLRFFEKKNGKIIIAGDFNRANGVERSGSRASTQTEV